MKWAQGFDIAWLKELSGVFKARNKPFVHGAFGIPNERDIATALQRDQLMWTKSPDGTVAGVAIFRLATRGSYKRDFAQRRVQIKPGDVVVSNAAASPLALLRMLNSIETRARRPIVLEMFVEDRDVIEAIEENGYRLIATKITASSDLKGLYIKGANPAQRTADPLEEADKAALKVLSEGFACVKGAQKEVAQIEEWAQHYSNYNKRSSWTALSLRGFSDDPGFIIKPSEMSKKWKQDNAPLLRAKCRPTPLASRLPVIQSIVDQIPGSKERVRLMRLSANGGRLSRHADITDRSAGTKDGMVLRLHVPIQTNKACIFRSWTLSGAVLERFLPAGCLAYLDVRKPHEVINKGHSDRLHLVVDVFANDELRRMIR